MITLSLTKEEVEFPDYLLLACIDDGNYFNICDISFIENIQKKISELDK